MAYDIFISYSRKDNVKGRVTELKEHLEADYLEFTGKPLKCFFDQEDIKGMDDWKHRLLQGLMDSQILLLILTPNYLASEYCEWEVVEYLKHEYARALQGEGIAQVYFIEIPGLDDDAFKEQAATWVKRVSGRQRIDMKPWYDAGANALKMEDVKRRLEEFRESLHSRITRITRIKDAKGNLPNPNPNFIGRQEEMKKLHDSVASGKFGAITAAHGVGGLGKTAIAFQYAYVYADFYPGGRWHVGCAGEHNLASVLRKLDVDLGIELKEDERKDDTRAAKRILNELEQRASEGAEARKDENNPPNPAVLLLLDNVDDAKLLQPPDSDLISGKGWLKVLATTRLGEKDLGLGDHNTFLTIDELPFDDALALIESFQPGARFPNVTERENAGEIVKLLGGFTLAVELAAIYLGERHGTITCAAFLELLKREGSLEGIDLVASNTTKAISHEKLISATLIPTLDLLSPAELLIMEYAALLPPDTIPLPWLRAVITEKFPELAKDALPGLDDPWLSTINHLLSYRLLQVKESDDIKPRIVRMHRLLQRVVKNKSNSVEELIIKLLDQAISRSKFLKKNWFKKNYQWEIEPFVKFSSFLIESKQTSAATLTTWLGFWLISIYSPVTLKELFSNAIALLKSQKQEEEIDYVRNYDNLALTEQALGNYTEAKALYKKALQIRKKALPPDDRDLAASYHNIAVIEQALGNYTEAKAIYKKALKISKKILPPEHPNLATSYSNLALTENALGNHTEAKALLKKALEITKKALPPDPPSLASVLFKVAKVEHALGNYTEAKEIYKKALKISKKILPAEHPNLAISYNNLALVEQGLGNLIEAKALHEKALKIYEKALPPDHPNLAISYNNLASVEQGLGNTEKSLRILLKGYRKSNNKWTEKKLYSIFRLSSLLGDKGDLDEAIKVIVDTEEIIEKSELKKTQKAASIYNQYGWLLKEKKLNKEAIEKFIQSTESNPKFANPWYWLGKLYQQSKVKSDTAKEKKAWERYLELGATSDERKEEAMKRLEELNH